LIEYPLPRRRGLVLSISLDEQNRLLFAGQGAQVAAWARTSPLPFRPPRAWFARANAALGYDLAAICFNGPEAELTMTKRTAGIFLVSWAPSTVKERVPALEFEATRDVARRIHGLDAAGAMSFEDGLRVVRQRGVSCRKPARQREAAWQP